MDHQHCLDLTAHEVAWYMDIDILNPYEVFKSNNTNFVKRQVQH